MKLQLKNFLKNKLTDKSLRHYEETLNTVYNNKISAQNNFYDAKRKLAYQEIDKKKYKELKQIFKDYDKKYKELLHDKSFKKNVKYANFLLHHTSKKSAEWFKVKKESQKAQKLYLEFKKIVLERGQFTKINKLSEYAIEVEGLNFQYNSNLPLVLNDVSFKIKDGEYVAIIGHNGSGKSTLSKILIGVIGNEIGTVKMFGNLVNRDNINQIRQFLGIVFQNPDNQFIGSTVRADIAFGLENKCVSPKDMPEIIERSAKMVGMEKFLDFEPLNLSGGQKQRVAIASAIALNPNILIFDEATSMLDPKGKNEIKKIMLALRKQKNKTILSITHDMDEILNADKVLVMNQGKLVRYGTPMEIINDEGFLKSIHLNTPFIFEVYDELKKNGININKSINMDDLAEELCKK